MDNQQLFNLKNDVLQVLISGKLGDGCFHETTKSMSFTTNSIHQEYIMFKMNILSKEFTVKDKVKLNNGFKKGTIYDLYVNTDIRIRWVFNTAWEDLFSCLDDLGLALWIYDDGTKHKTKDFYQISTHSFSRELQEDLFIPTLKNKWGIKASCIPERKKDGREFWYLNISKYKGAYEINKILSKIPLNCFKYKLWSSTTIQKWSKFQEELKRRDITKLSDKSIRGLYASIWRKL